MANLTMTEERKNHLTDEEWNAIQHLTRSTHLDEVFDVWQRRNGDDCFKDFETGRLTTLSAGLKWLYEGIQYPLAHEGLNDAEAKLIYDLFVVFKTTKDDLSWLLEKEE